MIAIPTPDNSPAKHFKAPKKWIIVVSSVLAFVIVLVSILFVMVKLGEWKLKKSLIANENIEVTEEGFDDNAIYYDGKSYTYNSNLINLLLIGVDRQSNENIGHGQADALYLASVDTKANTVKIISISRNTVCDIMVYGSDGKPYGTEHKQICLAYSYGTNKVKSSENCVNAVSNLLYNVPINGYYTIYFDSLSKIVDMIGGVRVQLTPELSAQLFQTNSGGRFTLNGEKAIKYLRTRKDSNAPRVERHKEFISSFIDSAKVAIKKDISLPMKIANRLSNEAVTNIDVSSMLYLAMEAINWKMDFVNINGEYSIDNELEIFTVDESSLEKTVIDNFYIAEK